MNRTGHVDVPAVYERALGSGVRPYEWQTALATGEWPSVLVAPTGSGKTAAVTLGWAVRRLRRSAGTRRRLVWCLPMRTLVEQTTKAVRHWFDQLAPLDEANRLPRRKDVYTLMGGANAASWIERPERPAVLVGTQDMLLSRALMRGYASSRALWPMEFALLHEDAQWVFDEVQLMDAGRATSAQLEAFRQAESARTADADISSRRPSRSLWVSATLDPGWLKTVDHPEPQSVVRVDPLEDGRLARLARATKQLRRSQVAPASSKKEDVKAYIRDLAEAVLGAHRHGRMTLVIVNRVDRARNLHEALAKGIGTQGQPPPTLALIHSRFRPLDREREMAKVTNNSNPCGRIVVATQAIEAGVDISAAVLFTEVAPWSSMVQRFGRANRYAEHPEPDGADVRWIDLLQAIHDGTGSEKHAENLAAPYTVSELASARERLAGMTDVAPVHLPPPDDLEPPRRVIRRKDLDDLFDTDPDLTGFDVDVSAYVRDTDDTDIRVFWRDLSLADDELPRPRREELCAVSIGVARDWLGKLRKQESGNNLVFQRDPQWRRNNGASTTAPIGWSPFRDQPWPGLVLLADLKAGGYLDSSGFTGDPKHVPNPVAPDDLALPTDADGGPGSQASSAPAETEGHDEDHMSQINAVVSLDDHLQHVMAEVGGLCRGLDIEPSVRAVLNRAARWHDVGKAHDIFQDTMCRGLGDQEVASATLLAKTVGRARHSRPYFRHELASALAFLAHAGWSRDADLIAYLIAAHHGKVRMNLRALPRELAPKDEGRATARFARGVWEGDELPPLDLEGNEHWSGGPLLLSVMELGYDEITHESWTERTRDLLERFGPFHLAWLETVLRIADWRASAKERERDL